MEPKIFTDAERPTSSAAPAVSQSMYRRFAAAFAIAGIYAMVAAAAFNGYYTKWFLGDGIATQSIVNILDGTAARPYVYRQLLPQMATAIERALPEALRARVEDRLRTADGALRRPSGVDAARDGYILRYRIVYYLTFLSLFLSLFALRSVCRSIGASEAAATLAPAIFVIVFPILQTRGGFFYDLPEILALALAARFALGAQIVPLLLLAVPATANKEAFLFYCIALLPLLMVRLPVREAVTTAFGAAFVSGLTYLALKYAYAANPGDNAIFQLFENILFYLNPLNLFMFDQTYGLPLFKGYGVVVFGWFAIMMAYGWRMVPAFIHQHLALAACINVPLLMIFAAGGEVRNLSLLYVAIVALMAGAVDRWLSTATAGPSSRQ